MVKALMNASKVEATQAEIQGLERQLTQPHLQDPGATRNMIRGLNKALEEGEPRPFVGHELDVAVAR